MSRPTALAREQALERDGRACAGCGIPVRPGMWWSLQHRVRRQVGGHRLSNLLVLCGSGTSRGCHREAENRTEVTHLRGLWLRIDENPLEHPVQYATADGPKWFLLNDQGDRTECDAPAEWLAYERSVA